MNKWTYKVVHVDYVPDKRKCETIEEANEDLVLEAFNSIIQQNLVISPYSPNIMLKKKESLKG